MPININEELDTIENDEYFTTVRNAVHDGTTKVGKGYRADITEELETIRKGRYGIDIRMAIHDALEKLSEATSTGSGSGGEIIVANIVGGSDIVNHDMVASMIREDAPSMIPRTAAQTVPSGDNIYYDLGTSTVTLTDEYYGDATAIAILVYQNGTELTLPEGWTLANDPSTAALTYTPSETPANLFNTTTWLSNVDASKANVTKNTSTGTLTLTLSSTLSTVSDQAYTYPYKSSDSNPYQIPVTAGYDYIFEATITKSASIGTAYVDIFGNGSTTNRLTRSRITSDNLTLKSRFTVPTGVTYVTICLRVGGPASSGTQVSISNISIKLCEMDQRIGVYTKLLTREDKTASFVFTAKNATNNTGHVEGLLIVKSDHYDVSALESGVVNTASFTPTSMRSPNRPLLYAVAARGWNGSACSIQVSGGTSSTEDKLHTVDCMRLSATYDITHLPLQTEPTFASSSPVTTGFNGTMQYFLMKLDPHIDE